MEKRTNKYRLHLEYLAAAREETVIPAPLELEFENHDNIFDIIERLKEKNLFEETQEAAEFAVGLKLFSEVMIRNKNNPLFEDFSPAFGAFMKKLKST